jgi:hypothetical protein
VSIASHFEERWLEIRDLDERALEALDSKLKDGDPNYRDETFDDTYDDEVCDD